ncbi:hypothetical protein POPTR_007G039601v4 [Populus trichocarpa]|uniref:Uncharacterized protein n=1 Tax=Populus trichocarpa TaxID=3694 RepID=A0ACC0SP91_POPTR|nr:hypothetical protein POPTR_007G039601v4 [Populus trichocarpa]
MNWIKWITAPQIDQSPADHCLNINSSHRSDSTKRNREDILVSNTPAKPPMNTTERLTSDK